MSKSCPTHCCPRHGCKYGYDAWKEGQCEVSDGTVAPVWPNNNGCEMCEAMQEQNAWAFDVLDDMIEECDTRAKNAPTMKGKRDLGPMGHAMGVNIRRLILREVRDRLEAAE